MAPATIVVPVVVFTDPVIAGPSGQFLIITFVAHAHADVQLLTFGNKAPAGLAAPLPVVHVILLKTPGWTESPDGLDPEGLFNFGRGGLVDEDTGLNLCVQRPPGLPNPEGPKARMAWIRKASLTSGGAALSTKTPA